MDKIQTAVDHGNEDQLQRCLMDAKQLLSEINSANQK